MIFHTMVARRRARRGWVALLLLAGAACGETEPTRPSFAPVAGEYRLRIVNGATLPAVTSRGEFIQSEVLTLTADGRYVRIGNSTRGFYSGSGTLRWAEDARDRFSLHPSTGDAAETGFYDEAGALRIDRMTSAMGAPFAMDSLLYDRQ